MAERRRVNVNQEERRLVREAHREHPNNPELQMDWLMANIHVLPDKIQEIYTDRRRGLRRLREIIRRELDE